MLRTVLSKETASDWRFAVWGSAMAAAEDDDTDGAPEPRSGELDLAVRESESGTTWTAGVAGVDGVGLSSAEEPSVSSATGSGGGVGREAIRVLVMSRQKRASFARVAGMRKKRVRDAQREVEKRVICEG